MANPNSQAELGYESHLEFEVTDGMEDFAEVEECGDLPEFGDEYQEVEATNQQSPGRRIEYISGFAEGQEFTIECNWYKATVQEAVRAAQGTTRNFRMVYSTTPETTFEGPAVIKSVKITAPTKEIKKMMITLRKTGNWTETEGAVTMAAAAPAAPAAEATAA
jgi:Lambda phage tail tube protein, TTP